MFASPSIIATPDTTLTTPTSGHLRLWAGCVFDGICGLLLLAGLLLPNNLGDITPAAFALVPLEAVALGLLLMVPGRAGWLLRLLASALLAMGMLVKVADLACFEIYARPFNPVFDAYLLRNGLHLLQGALGELGALVVAVLLVIVAAGLVGLAFWLLSRLAQRLTAIRWTTHRGWSAGLALGILAGLAIWSGRAATPFYDLLASHWRDTASSIHELNHFQQEIAANRDLQAELPANQLFSKLKGKDVALVFIESYGRSALDKPEFSAQLRPLLQAGGDSLEQLGLHSRSAYLTSSTMGGLSWLAQGTALSGLWINSQVRYDSLIMSQRKSLNHLFQRAGWRTVAVKPAITLDWPEGRYFGYDQIYAARDLGYAGKPFNWVTMPDQYTLSAFEARERQQDHPPVMAEIALISSHAPWTPVPTLVDWQAVGDGRLFDSQASSGASPDEVWQDDVLIRRQYAKSVGYSLQTLISYAETYGDDKLVIIAFGDHQPAPLVTGETPNRDVPIHIIARDPAVLAAINDWQWTPGLVPAKSAPVWPMSDLRNRVVEAFSGAGTNAVQASLNQSELQ